MDGSKHLQLPDQLVYYPLFKEWKELGGVSKPGELSVNLALYAKTLDIFHFSDYCYFIFNLQDVKTEWCSKGVKKLLGLEIDEFGVAAFFSMLHPEDLEIFQQRELLAIKFFKSLPKEHIFKYKLRHDFRLILKDGTIKRILEQAVVIQIGEDGQFQRTLLTLTDVDFLGEGFVSGLSFIGLDGLPSYSNIDLEKGWEECTNPLSPREVEILALLCHKKDSSQIAEILNISVETVKKHRKNMIEKTGCSDTNELVLKALRKCWV